MSDLMHDARVRNIDGVYRAHCRCGWRSDLHPDSSTAWCFAQDHVVSAMGPAEGSSDFAAAFAERREAEINASLLTRDEWQIDPDLLAAQRMVANAEQIHSEGEERPNSESARREASIAEQVHRIITTEQDAPPRAVAEEIVNLVEDQLLADAMDYLMARDGIGYVVEMLARRRETGRWSDG